MSGVLIVAQARSAARILQHSVIMGEHSTEALLPFYPADTGSSSAPGGVVARARRFSCRTLFALEIRQVPEITRSKAGPASIQASLPVAGRRCWR